MEFNYFDMIVGIIILLLGLKGIFNGFFKELFGLIGIVGGIFVASRFGDEVGIQLSELVFKLDSSSAISFSGFVVTLILFWIAMIIVGTIFQKLSQLSGLGIFDKIFGFLFGASKFFLITAVISHAAYNIKALKTSIDPLIETSVLFPILTESGAYIMQMDPVEIGKDMNISLGKQSENSQQYIDTVIEKSTENILNDVKNNLTEKPE